MNRQGLMVPWLADCTCGRQIWVWAPVDHGGDGHYIRCSDCGHINHTTERVPGDEIGRHEGAA